MDLINGRIRPLTKIAAKGCHEHNNRTRENNIYQNKDIDLTKTDDNFYYKKCTEADYMDALDKMEKEKIVSLRGMRLKDASTKYLAEMVVNVSTEYFERNGGRTFAINFYQDVYQFLVDKLGGEQYILEAVVHCDEIHAVTGKPTYHCHLVFAPVNRKEIRWTKKCKEKELIGKIKRTEYQVSFSKFFKSEKDEKGKWELSYSRLQSELADYIMSKGYAIKRGKVGSNAKHLSMNEYKQMADRINEEAQTLIQEIVPEKVEKDNVSISKKDWDNIHKLQMDLSRRSCALEKAMEEYNHECEKIAEKSRQVGEVEYLEKAILILQKKCQQLKNCLERLTGLLVEIFFGKKEIDNNVIEYMEQELLNSSQLLNNTKEDNEYEQKIS